MALPGVVVKIGGEARGALTAIDNVGDALGKLPGKASSAAQGVGRAASDLAAHVRRSGDDTEQAGGKFKRTFDATGDSAVGAASQIGESFGSGGGIAAGLGGLGEVVESFAGMFGPAGVLVGIAGGVGLGAIGTFVGRAKQKLEELEQKAEGVFEALVAGKGVLDDAFKEQALQVFIQENYKLLGVLKTVAGPSALGYLKEALSGNKGAMARLRGEIKTSRDELITQRSAIINSAGSTGHLTAEQEKQVREMGRQIEALGTLSGELGDTSGASKIARTQIELLNDAHAASPKSAKKMYDAQYKVTQQLYDEGEAAKVAARNTEILLEKQRHARIRGTPPPGALFFDDERGWIGKDKKGRYVVLQPPNRQTGGQVEAGHAYTVGEGGPETFIPNTSGRIEPTTGGVGTLHVHLHAAVMTPALVRQAAPTIAAAVADSTRRGAGPRTRSVYRGVT